MCRTPSAFSWVLRKSWRLSKLVLLRWSLIGCFILILAIGLTVLNLVSLLVVFLYAALLDHYIWGGAILFVIGVCLFWFIGGKTISHLCLKCLGVTEQKQKAGYRLLASLFVIGYVCVLFAIRADEKACSSDWRSLMTCVADELIFTLPVWLFWLGFSLRYFGNEGWLPGKFLHFKKSK